MAVWVPRNGGFAPLSRRQWQPTLARHLDSNILPISGPVGVVYWAELEVPAAPNGNTTLPVTRAAVYLLGRQVTESLTLRVGRAVLRITGTSWTAELTESVVRTTVVVSGRPVTLAVTGGGASLTVSRAQVLVAGRQVTQALVVPVSRAAVRTTGRAVTQTFAVPVTRATIRVVGRSVTASTSLAVQRAAVRVLGRDVTVTAGASLSLPVTRASVQVAGRAVAEQLTLAVQRAPVRLAGRQIALAVSAAVSRQALRVVGRQIAETLGLKVDRGVVRIAGRDVTVTLVAGLFLQVDRAAIRVVGRQVTATTSFAVQRSVIQVAGRQVALQRSIDLQRAAVRIAGREVGLTVPLSLPVTRAALRITGRDVLVFPQSDLTLDVARARAAIVGRGASASLAIAVQKQALTLAGRDIALAIVGNFTLDVGRAALVATGRDVALRISTPAVAQPGGWDAVTMGRRARANRLPNVRFTPPARGKVETKRAPARVGEQQPPVPAKPVASRLLQALIKRIDLPPAPPPPPVGEAAAKRAEVRVQRHEAATSPTNDRAEPTPAQKSAGNYKKGHISLFGLRIAIENPVGSTRSGPGWSVVMSNDYGQILGTRGGDDELIDVYLGPHLTPDCPVFVIDQHDPADGSFDEHKAILGALDADEAEAIYDAHFSDGSGPRRRAATVRMSLEQFRRWLDGEDTAEPAVEHTPDPSPTDVAAELRAALAREISDLRDQMQAELDEVRDELARERAQRLELERAAADLRRRRKANKAAIDVAMRALLGDD